MTTMTNASTLEPASGAPGPAVRLAGMLSPEAIDGLLADAEAAGTAIDGPDGLLAKMTKAVLERALDVEITDHLGYEAGDRAGQGSGNSRNGHGRKTVHTTAGPVALEVPRDRNGSFAPQIVPKRKRRLGTVEDMILSLHARGMSTRDITAHLAEVYGTSVSAATISRVTDVVVDEIAAWQSRPVDPVYPILYIDAIRIKVRDAGVVAKRPFTWLSGWIWRAASRSWGCGSSRPRARSSGPGCSPSCATVDSRTPCSSAATGSPGCPRRSTPSGPRRWCRPAWFT